MEVPGGCARKCEHLKVYFADPKKWKNVHAPSKCDQEAPVMMCRANISLVLTVSLRVATTRLQKRSPLGKIRSK
jgi:hypothetical protein